MSEKEITFDDMMEMDGRLRRLRNAARMIGRKRGKNFCANFIWYNLFKPQLVELVGDHRMIRRDGNPFAFEKVDFDLYNRVGEVEYLKHLAVKRIDEVKHDPGFLGTSKAYDIAYHTIFEELPDCRNCGCL